MFGLLTKTRGPQLVAPEYIGLRHSDTTLDFINQARKTGLVYEGHGYAYAYTSHTAEGQTDFYLVQNSPGPVVQPGEVELIKGDM